MSAFAKFLIRGSIRFLAVVGGYWIAAGMVLSFDAVLESIDVVWSYGALFAVIGPIVDHSVGMRRAHWRYISVHDLVALIRSSIMSFLVLLLAIFFIDRGWQLPRSTLILAFGLDLGLTAGLLILRRMLHEGGVHGLLQAVVAGNLRLDGATALVLVGSPDQADAFLRGHPRGAGHGYSPIGIISDAPESMGQSVRGVPVMGTTAKIESVLSAFADRGGAKAAIFLGEEAHTLIGGDLAARLLNDGVKLLRLPKLTDLSDSTANSPREINVEELLPRPPIRLDLARIQQLVAGKRVMVTGAGGSIGSELCRQVTALGCAHISLLDNSEFLLFTIGSEIEAHRPTLSRREILCDVRDAERVRLWVKAERPDIVFHAAALKHVPLVELHPDEGALTNVVGTWNVAQAAHECGVRQMIFISTDKAVQPSNVMGATKRLAESVIRTHQLLSETRFSVVRFGNVLGSHGSVVPTFLKQIERGGPITLTHPDVERFFMTIPEAVQLVLHTTAKSLEFPKSEAGVFVLEMGKPVKIMDLAKQLISLRGKRLGRDIAIEITGLRPGEKLTEALVDSSEQCESASDGVLRVTDRVQTTPLGQPVVNRLEKLASSGDKAGVRDLVFELLSIIRQDEPAGGMRPFEPKQEDK